MPYTCQVCFKTFSRKFWYDRHCVVCTEKSQLTTRREELDDLPPPYVMYQMILNLNSEVTKLKKTISKLQENSTKLSVIMETLTPCHIYFEDWVKQLTISKKDIYTIIHNGYLKGILDVIWNFADTFDDPPITVENNKIIIYSSQGWVKLNKTFLKILVEHIQKQIPSVFEKQCPEYNSTGAIDYDSKKYLDACNILFKQPPSMDTFMKHMCSHHLKN